MLLASIVAATLVAGPGDDGSADQRWLKRHAPQRGELELGLVGGVHWTSRLHMLLDDDRLDRHERIYASPQLGLRLGMYPLSFLGFEAEGGGGPVRISAPDGFKDDRGALINARGHIVAQLPLWSISPFVLFGGGLLALASPASSLGRDTDGVFHAGAGVKLNLIRRLGFRLEYRHTFARRCDETMGNASQDARVCTLPVSNGPFRAHNPQIMLSITLRLRGD